MRRTHPNPNRYASNDDDARDNDDNRDELLDDDDSNSNSAGTHHSTSEQRKEEARQQRMNAEQRRRDQLRDGYDRLQSVLPQAREKLSKVKLIECGMCLVIFLSFCVLLCLSMREAYDVAVALTLVISWTWFSLHDGSS